MAAQPAHQKARLVEVASHAANAGALRGGPAHRARECTQASGRALGACAHSRGVETCPASCRRASASGRVFGTVSQTGRSLRRKSGRRSDYGGAGSESGKASRGACVHHRGGWGSASASWGVRQICPGARHGACSARSRGIWGTASGKANGRGSVSSPIGVGESAIASAFRRPWTVLGEESGGGSRRRGPLVGGHPWVLWGAVAGACRGCRSWDHA